MRCHLFPLLKSLLDLFSEGVGGRVLVEWQADDVLEEFLRQDAEGTFLGNVELGSPSTLAEGLNDRRVFRVEVETSIAFGREGDADIIPFLGDAFEAHRAIDVFSHKVLREL